MIPTRTSRLRNEVGRGKPRPQKRLSYARCGQVLKGGPACAGGGFPLPLYYFDLETTGDDPQQDRIVTVQYQPLADDLSAVGPFQVIAEWEWGERQVVQMALEKGVLEPTWDFVPVGNRLRFDLTFLLERATKWKLIDWDLAKLKYFWYTKPYVDLGPILVMLNRGSLAGSALHNFSDKESGAKVPKMYHQGLYTEIIDYVTRERDAAVDLLRESREFLGSLGDRRRRPQAAASEAKP
jgi:hypothetical protein